jgi:hypothetical protein
MNREEILRQLDHLFGMILAVIVVFAVLFAMVFTVVNIQSRAIQALQTEVYHESNR